MMPRMRRRSRLLGATIAALAASAPPLLAHLVTRGAGTACVVAIQEGKVLLTFDLSFSQMWGQAEMVSMDSNRDSEVDEAESEAFMRRAWEERLAPWIELRIDGEKLAVRKVSSREDNLLGEIAPTPFSIYYDLEAEIPPAALAPGRSHRLEIENHTLKRESPMEPTFYVPMDPGAMAAGLAFEILAPPILLDALGAVDMYTTLGRKLVVKFEFTGGGPLQEEAAPPAAAADPRARVAEDATSAADDFFAEQFHKAREGRLSFGEALVAILLAMVYGAGHAFAPGHGKTMVAAYLVGTRGRIRDAVTLGLAATWSHVITVFLAGVGLYLLMELGAKASTVAMKNRLIVAAEVVSALLLLLLGLTLFFRRWRFAGDPGVFLHSHDHHHHHDHEHGHEPRDHHHGHSHRPLPAGRPTFWTLVALGTSGGLVPCPAGIMVILLGLHYQHRGALLYSLVLLIFFSIALGGVLVALGIFVVTGRKPLEGKLKAHSKALSYVPALSALFIAGLGTYLAVRTFQGRRTEIAAMVEGLADLIRG